MSNYQYGQFTYTHLENTREGVTLFNQQKYWECHEVLEDHWLEERGDNARYVYWAIIQVAASMIHVRDKNLKGAQGLIAKAKKKFIKIDELHVKTELLKKYLDWDILTELVFSVPENAPLEKFEKLYEFRFKDPDSWKVGDKE